MPLMYEVVAQVQPSSSEGSERTEGAGTVDIKTACSSTALRSCADCKSHFACSLLQELGKPMGM